MNHESTEEPKSRNRAVAIDSILVIKRHWQADGGSLGQVWTAPRCKGNLTISEAFGCSHVSGL
jgi:hypothetical protein